MLAQDRDRFAREPAYLYLLQEEFAKHGAKLQALNARGDDTPEGQLTEGMLDQLAKYERAKIAERTRRGRLEKARRGGLKIGRVSKYGYVVNDDRSGYSIDPDTMPVVERIIKNVAAGVSVHGLKKAFESEGLPTPLGAKTWNRTLIRKIPLDDAYLPHSYAEIRELVAPEVAAKLDPGHYYGIIWHNRHRARVIEKVKIPGTDEYKYRRQYTERPREEWIAVPIPAPPNLDKETVLKARARISRNIRPPASNVRVWELSGGILYCGHCGARMRGRNQSSKGKSLFYYACSTKINETHAACPNRYHRAEPLEALVWYALSQLFDSPEALLDRIDEKIEEERGLMRDPAGQLSALVGRLEVLQSRRSRFLDLYADGLISSKADLGAKLDEIDRAEKDAQEAIEALKDRSLHIEKWHAQKRAAMLMYDAYMREAPQLFSPQARREMYERLGLRVTCYGDRDPEIEITLEPDALPTPEEARKAAQEAWDRAMGLEKIETFEGDVMPNDPTSSRCS